VTADHTPERLSAEERKIAEALLLAMDGDFLPGAGLSIGNTGQDVTLDRARPKEVAHWAASVIAPWLTARVDAVEDERDQAQLNAMQAKAETAEWVSAYDAELVNRKAAEHRINQALAFLDARDSIDGACLPDEIRSLLDPPTPHPRRTPMSDLSDRIQAPTRMVHVTVMYEADIEAGEANYLPSRPSDFAAHVAYAAGPSDERLTNYRVVGVATVLGEYVQEEIGGDECADLLPGDESLPLAKGAEDPSLHKEIHFKGYRDGDPSPVCLAPTCGDPWPCEAFTHGVPE
jgi:hypothetical protein